MIFVPPGWFEGTLIFGLIFVLPVIIGILLVIIGGLGYESIIASALGVLIIIGGLGLSGFVWHELYEVPSVNEATITVQEWQPRVGLRTNENGMMVVDSADDLMLVSDDGTCFYNEENFWFQKFNTRDVFNQLKVNGTYKIKYYGWREPFNNGFPNILSVEKVIYENNTSTPHYSDYFGVKLVK